MRNDITSSIGWTEEALNNHLADKDRRRARREAATHDQTYTPGSRHQRKAKHNRAAAERAWRREVRL